MHAIDPYIYHLLLWEAEQGLAAELQRAITQSQRWRYRPLNPLIHLWEALRGCE